MTASTIQFTILGKAKPAGSKTVGYTSSGRHFLRDASGRPGYEWRQDVAQMGRLAMRGAPPLEGPLFLTLAFWIPRPKAHFGTRGNLLPSAPVRPTSRPDILKLTRGIEDALTSIVWRDDAQIVREWLEKNYGEPARAEISVEPWPYP